MRGRVSPSDRQRTHQDNRGGNFPWSQCHARICYVRDRKQQLFCVTRSNLYYHLVKMTLCLENVLIFQVKGMFTPYSVLVLYLTHHETSIQNIPARRHGTVSSLTWVIPASTDWTLSTYTLKPQVKWPMISLQHCKGLESMVTCPLPMYRSYRPYQPLAKGLLSRNQLVWPQHRSQHSTGLPQVVVHTTGAHPMAAASYSQV